MSEDGNHNLDPIDPSTAQQLYLDHKASQAMEKTVQGHRYRTNHFVRWCDEKGIDNMNDLTGRHIHEYRLWRKEDGDLNAVSLQTQMSTIRVFLRWCGSIEAVDPNLYTKVMLPQVPPEDQQRDELLEKERAEEILSYLSEYHYASIKHIVLSLLLLRRHLWDRDFAVEVRINRLDGSAPAEKHANRAHLRLERYGVEIAVFLPPEPVLVNVSPRQVVHVVDALLVAPADEVVRSVAVPADRPLHRLRLLVIEVQFLRGARIDRFEIVISVIGHGFSGISNRRKPPDCGRLEEAFSH